MAFLELVSKSSVVTERPSIQEDASYYYVFKPDHSLKIRLRKRSVYPHTYCYIEDLNTVILGYGQKNPGHDDEYLRIKISANKGISIDRDIYATLPLFYGNADGLFVLSNDYGLVCDTLPRLTLSNRGILDTLLVEESYRVMIWKEVGILYACQKLSVTNRTEPKVQHFKTRDWTASRHATKTNPRDFFEMFSRHLNQFAEKYVNQNAAFEISGGLDSATLPLYLARMGKKLDATAGSLIFPGNFGIRQQNKLRAISAATGLTIYPFLLNSNLSPLPTNIDNSHNNKQFYCFKGPHEKALIPMLDEFASTGKSIVISGTGGDECMENVTNDSKAERLKLRAKNIPSFITNEAISQSLEWANDYLGGPSPMSIATLNTPSVGYNAYIERNLWPVSPFLNKVLYTNTVKACRLTTGIIKTFCDYFTMRTCYNLKYTILHRTNTLAPTLKPFSFLNHLKIKLNYLQIILL
jgi:hypothetical protein